MKKLLKGLFKKKRTESTEGEFILSEKEEDENALQNAQNNASPSFNIESEKNLNNPLNAVPFEWARPIIENTVSKHINKEIIKKGAFFLFLFMCFLIFFGTVFFLKTLSEKEIITSTEKNKVKIEEFEAVAENITIYKSYVEIPNTPSIYTQFYGIVFLAVRNGFLVEKLSFSTNLSSDTGGRINKDSFAVDMGKKLENVKVQGIWTLTGILSPRLGAAADGGWSMNFAKQVNILFSKQNVSTYTRVSLPQEMNRDSPEASVTILLWK